MGTTTNLYAVADDFQLPMTGYEAGSFNERVLGASGNHLGEDHQASHYDPVYAIADGVVVWRQWFDDYGMLLVIEHTLIDSTKYCSVYGHLCSHSGHTPVSLGSVVQKGDHIACIGDDAENGDNTEHLHLGLRRAAHPGSWVYYGYAGHGENYDYSDAQHRKPGYGKFTAASAFINGIVLSDGVNVLRPHGGGVFSNGTPLEVDFEIQNLTSHTIYIQDLTVALHKTETSNGHRVGDLKKTGPITLNPYGQPGDSYVYTNYLSDANSVSLPVTLGDYYVRAKYTLNGNDWIDIPIHFKNAPEMSETTENSVPLSVEEYAGIFSDISDKHEMYYYIEQLYNTPSRNDYWGDWVVSGYGNGTFGPDDTLTRGEICTMICRAKGLPWNPAWNDGSFSDVNGSSHKEAIYACKHYGYVSGYGDGTFGPGDNITRSQICKILSKAYGFSPDTPDPDRFSDWDATDPELQGYVAAIVEKCIVEGYPDGRFGMNDDLKRGHACKFFKNTMDAYNNGSTNCN
ncbi:MAG: S-layer homology domain-containing protein [Candidatus Gracilibacteria bacterium]|nr:S-layer homology domain-containing protein [Candidatus Gracilibacteria bacterium]